MEAVQSLYRSDLVLKSDARTQEEVFHEIGSILLEKDLVNNQFIEAIKERENNFPTGLDLSPVADNLSNVAIPHTETEYCKANAIVFVKLNHPIPFHNMIAPDQVLDVKYLFFIINKDASNQTNVLSDLMGFMTNVENMTTLEKLDSTESIYEFLIKSKGEMKND